METTYEVWDALVRFFLNVANGLVLAGIVAYVFQDKNLVVGVLIVASGVYNLLMGLYITNIAARLKREEK